MGEAMASAGPKTASPGASWRMARRQVDAALRALVEPDPDVAAATTSLRAAWGHLLDATGGVVPGMPAPQPQDDAEDEEDEADEADEADDADDAESASKTDAPDPTELARAWMRAHYGDDAHVEGGCLPWLFPQTDGEPAPPLPSELRSHAKWVRTRILEQLAKQQGVGRMALGFLIVMVIVIASALLLGDLQGGKEPWRAEYYSSETFKGKPKVEFIEKIEFDWGKGEPLRGVPVDEFSIRFTTCMTVDEDTKVSFDLTSDDGSRMFVNGNQIIDNWGPHGTKSKKGSVDLEPGVHLLEVEYFDRRYGAKVTLEMKGPDDDKYDHISLDKISPPVSGDDPCELGDDE